MLLQGGPPPAPPAAPRGAGLSARRLCKICRGGTNNLSLVRSSSVQTGKCILYAEKFMPGRKKLAEELFFLKPTVFTPYGRKNNCWFVGKKSSPASFSMPGINLPAYRNIYSGLCVLNEIIPKNILKFIVVSRNNNFGICVPVGWQIYARHGKASGRTFFSDKPTVVFNDRRE